MSLCLCKKTVKILCENCTITVSTETIVTSSMWLAGGIIDTVVSEAGILDKLTSISSEFWNGETCQIEWTQEKREYFSVVTLNWVEDTVLQY